jgi:tol-pal system protein YbgF
MLGSKLSSRVYRAAAAALFLATLSGCPFVEVRDAPARPSPEDDLAQKVMRLERALSELQRGQTPDVQLQKRVDDQGRGLADLRVRIDELSTQAAAVQGRIEALEKTQGGERESARIGLSQWEARLSELDKKLDRLEKAQAAVRPAEPPRPAPVPVVERPQQQPPEKRVTPQALYDEAYGLYRKQGKHEEAREKFKAFIQTYPDAPLVPNAHFWVGESYYDQAQYEPAILEYDNVIKRFPKSDKVPSALLKQAFAFDALNDPGGAKTLLRKLVRDFPKSDQAAIAQKKLDALGE